MTVKNTYKQPEKEKRLIKQAELHRRCLMLLATYRKKAL